jgi:phosphoglycolate phosphatase
MWNIDQTLLDVARVSRDAYAEAFKQVTGRPLVALPQLAGESDSEIFFGSLALNPALVGAEEPEDEKLLELYYAQLTAAFAARRSQLARHGRLLPGAREAIAAVAVLPGAVQTVLTGNIKPNAAEKLRAFDLDRHLDLSVGGFGSDAYPRGTMILRMMSLVAEKYGAQPDSGSSVYVADSARDMTAAQVGGVRGIGVATGRATVRELLDAGAEVVLDDLSDTGRLVAAIGH